MRRVMDQLFCEKLSFSLSDELYENSPPEVVRGARMALCRADYIKALCAMAGLELLEYDSAFTERLSEAGFTYVELHSKAFNAKALR